MRKQLTLGPIGRPGKEERHIAGKAGTREKPWLARCIDEPIEARQQRAGKFYAPLGHFAEEYLCEPPSRSIDGVVEYVTHPRSPWLRSARRQRSCPKQATGHHWAASLRAREAMTKRQRRQVQRCRLAIPV